MITDILCPPNEERDRSTAGMEAYGDGQDRAITNDDPRTEYTFDEFPMDSFDILVDRALHFVRDDDDGDGECRTMVDLGSGCGRLCFYAALTRGGICENKTRRWNVHGVEIGSKLHSLAVNSLERGINNGWFEEHDSNTESSSLIAFLNGNALTTDDPYFKTDAHINNNIQSLLSETSILFCYSTVWEAETDFNPEISAMLLHEKWSKSLANACSNGCVAVTTDRSLNPIHGWKLIDRLEVENPSVWGSTGYISILEK